MALTVGRQVCGSLGAAADREWLVSDGVGGFAMGTVAGLRSRRYHGLLVVATEPPIGRRLALAALDPVLVIGDRRIALGTHEWADGTIDPAGHVHLESFHVRDGLPRWRWSIGDVTLDAELAMAYGRPAVGVAYRLVRAAAPVRLEVDALCTWRDVHGERFAGDDPAVTRTADGFVFEDAYRVRGPGFEPGGTWYRGSRQRAEADRGLNAVDDLWFAGRFVIELAPGHTAGIEAWAGDLQAPEPPPAARLVDAARGRAVAIADRAEATDRVGRTLANAADQFVVAGPTIVAGYRWFGDWSRDTMTSYEGLLLATNRWDEGRELLIRAAAGLSAGMLSNTADAGGTEYNTVDATLWFLHAVGRHVDATGDVDLAAQLAPELASIIAHHVEGTRFGIGVDAADGLLRQGATGAALTWMDARVDGVPVTPRWGKPVEVNALWINGLAVVGAIQERLRIDASETRRIEALARRCFVERFVHSGGLFDVIDGPAGDDASLRPNQLLAVSLPHGPSTDDLAVRACAPLLTSVGMRSLDPADARFIGRHRGGPSERDHAYHQGTVWPWLIGPYVEATLKTGGCADGLVDGLESHVGEWGLGSVSETADGDAPHDATGCPFQAWSVAELIRARRLVDRRHG
jgi:predicted glycogen debranching enzyme